MYNGVFVDEGEKMLSRISCKNESSKKTTYCKPCFLVSIVIPAYNASLYLTQAIESALAQTYQAVEVIVINDGSTDDGTTRKIGMSYGDRIRYYEKENGGCASALNYGIQVMSGEWFSWLSHDDLYMPEKIEKLIALIEKFNLNPESIVLGCNDLIMNPQGETTRNFFNNSTGILSPEKAFGETLNVKTINGCGLLIPKAILDRVGGFRTDYKHLLDREMWMRIALNRYSYCFDEKPLVISRVHNQQITVKGKDSLYQEESRLIDEYVKAINSNTKEVEFLKMLCYFAFKRKHGKQGKEIAEILKLHGKHGIRTQFNIIKFKTEGSLKRVVSSCYKKKIRHMKVQK